MERSRELKRELKRKLKRKSSRLKREHFREHLRVHLGYDKYIICFIKASLVIKQGFEQYQKMH